MEALKETPKPSSDEDLQRRVLNFLVGYRMPGLRRIDVEASGGNLLVRGHVRSYYEKQLCLHCCHRVAGVREITDEIVVDPA